MDQGGSISAPALRALRRLPSLMTAEGYVDFIASSVGLELDLETVRARVPGLPAPLDVLTTLFYLGAPVSASRLGTVLSAGEIAGLCELGVLLPRGELLTTGGFVLVPLLGQMVFVPVPSEGADAYFGQDSAELVTRILPPAGGNCLDLFAGPGHVTVRCAALCGTVVAVDRSPVSIACIELNAAMNAVDHRVSAREGLLYQPLAADERFDFVAAQPTTLPFSPGFPATGRADPDDDGTLLLWQTLEGLPAALSDRGVCQLTASATGAEARPDVLGRLSDLASRLGLHLHLTVLRRASLAPASNLFEFLARGCVRQAIESLDDARTRLAQHLASRNAQHLYGLALTVTRNPTRPDLRVTPLPPT